MLATVTEVFSHGGSGVRSKELKRGGIGSGGSYDDTVVHGVALIKLTDKLGDGRSLLSNTDVNACERVVLRFLVDDCINSDGSLSSLTITNDQFTLSTADGDQGVHSF